MNKYEIHVLVIPEDRADEQMAVGFTLHEAVKGQRIQVMPHLRGWSDVLQTFKDEYVRWLRNYHKGYVVMLIDFDGRYEERRPQFDEVVPDDLKHRVFVIGPKQTPEILKRDLGKGKSFEQIGKSLADECYDGTEIVWSHEQLKHNGEDRQRFMVTVKPLLFGP